MKDIQKIHSSYWFERALLKSKQPERVEFLTWMAQRWIELVQNFRIENEQLQPGGVVFVGDSLIEQYHLSAYFPNINVINRGIAGDCIQGVKERLHESIVHLRPSQVVVLIGTNDLGNERLFPDQIIEEMIDLLNKIQQVFTGELVVVSLLPVNETRHPNIDVQMVGIRRNNDIYYINQTLKHQLLQKPNLHFIDVYEQFLDESNQLRLEYTTDGLHCSPLGYSCLTKYLWSIVER